MSDCALDPSSHAMCFGNNDYGQLGDGSTTSSSVAVLVSDDHTYSALYAGYDWTCGTTMASETYCWGHNNWGALGPVLGTQSVESTPRLLSVPAGLSFTSMDGGLYHMCGIGEDTVVYCWGGGFTGQLGDGHATANFYATSVPAPVLKKS